MFDELAEAGVFSLRADGFAWADRVVVFEQLGRACVPGPLVAGAARRRRSAASPAVSTPPSGEHAASSTSTALDVVRRARRRRRIGASTRRRSTRRRRRLAARSAARRSRASTSLPPGEPLGRRDRRRELRRGRRACSPRRSASGWPTGCTELAVAYAKEREQFDRPIGSFQAVKHLLADMVVRTEVARAAVYAAGARARRPERAGELDRAVAGAKVLAGEAAVANGKTATQVLRRHGLHVGGRRAPLPEARVGARHPLRLRRREQRRLAALLARS